MKEIEGRTQGTWAHPALYEIGKALEPCIRLRDPWGRPCRKNEDLKKSGWCENCTAHAALDELTEILQHIPDLNDTNCSLCESVEKYLRVGAENDRKYGLRGLKGEGS